MKHALWGYFEVLAPSRRMFGVTEGTVGHTDARPSAYRSQSNCLPAREPSASAPRGLCRVVTGTPFGGAWRAACSGPHAASLSRARGYLKPGPCTVACSGSCGRCCGDWTRGASPPSWQFVRRRRQSRPHAAVRGLGTICCRSGRLWRREHTGAEQLGQSIPRANLEIAGADGCAPAPDGRLMRRCSGATQPSHGPVMALPSDHLELSARLGSRHRRRHSLVPGGRAAAGGALVHSRAYGVAGGRSWRAWMHAGSGTP